MVCSGIRAISCSQVYESVVVPVNRVELLDVDEIFEGRVVIGVPSDIR